MHISEGIIGAVPCLAGYAGTTLCLAWGLKKTDRDKIPATALMGAAFFAASLIHFKIGITSVHLTLLGLTAIILGSSAIPAIVAGLLFQALMFQHGGITTLGLNGLIMIIPAMTGQFLFRMVTKGKMNSKYISIIAGVISAFIIFLATIMAALVIALSGEGFEGIALFFSLSNGVLAIIEGFITALIVNRVLKIKPEMIYSWN